MAQDFDVALTRLGPGPHAHLAHAYAVAESLAFENPLAAVFLDGKETGGEDCSALAEKPADLVATDFESSRVRSDRKYQDAPALERIPDGNVLDFLEGGDFRLGIPGVLDKEFHQFVTFEGPFPLAVAGLLAPGRPIAS